MILSFRLSTRSRSYSFLFIQKSLTSSLIAPSAFQSKIYTRSDNRNFFGEISLLMVLLICSNKRGDAELSSKTGFLFLYFACSSFNE